MDLEKFVNDNKKYLQEDNITNITKHKIKYVSNYIENWTYIMCEHNKINTINFIDCMCNAGIYNDCTLSTSMEVLNIFVNQAIKYPGMKFNIFLNDILPERIDVIKKLSSIVNSKNLNNINIFYDTMDVNDYLDSIVKYNTYFQFGSSTVLCVDPYNFGDVKIHKLYEFSTEQCWKAIGYFREYYQEKGIFENRVYDGLEEVLKKLRNADVRLVVATSKPEPYARKIIDYFRLTPYFDYVAGMELDGRRKTKAEVIQYALEACKIKDKSSVLMIGDREHDVFGAKTAGIDCLGILYGFGNREELEEAGADYIEESVEDILKYC